MKKKGKKSSKVDNSLLFEEEADYVDGISKSNKEKGGKKKVNSKRKATDHINIEEKMVKPASSKKTSKSISIHQPSLLDIDDDEFETFEDESDEFSSDEETKEDEQEKEEKLLAEKRAKAHKKHIEDLKQRLGLSERDFVMYNKKKKKESNHKVVITAAGKPRKEPEVIVFEDPAKRASKRRLEGHVKQPVKRRFRDDEDDDDVFDMRHAKFDVHQFAIQRMEKQDKESAQMAHAIRLGAKPKKSAYVNYKVLQETKKNEKRLQEEKLLKEKVMGYKGSSIASNSQVKKTKKAKGPGTETKDGQIGTYKHGIQFLSSKDINKVRKK